MDAIEIRSLTKKCKRLVAVDKIPKIYRTLLSSYGPQGWWPVRGKYYPGDYSHPRNEQERFEIIIGAILTQNTAWKNVEKSLEELHRKKLMSQKGLKKVSQGKLSKHIRSSGYFNQKSRKIKEMIKFLESGMEMNRENLLGVWGIGPETADSILLYAFRKPVFVIDAYTKRVFLRLGFCDERVGYDELQNLFKSLPKAANLYNEYHALLVRLGKEVCTKKPRCIECPLVALCAHAKSFYMR